jgi:hypothetical protein
MARDPYAVLGIPRAATLDQAEEAYLRRMRLEHPDVHHLAGPERVAEAEQIARELTGAIHEIRAERAVKADVRTGAGPEPAGPDRARSSSASADDAGWQPGATWDADDRSWRPPNEPTEPAMAACPWCGQRFERGVDLKDHVFDDHDLRLDRRERNALFGGRIGRVSRAVSHLPLWFVIPVNALVAIVIGVLATAATDDVLGWWSAGIAMAPTAVVLIDRLADIEL